MYEARVKEEIRRWKRKHLRRPSMTTRYTKEIQAKVNEKIPEKVHTVITASIKNMVHATLVGSEYMSNKQPSTKKSLQEKEEEVRHITRTYKRTAALEGAGTGAGGILLGIADFPLLLSIKMKYLFAVATAYGFDVTDERERLFTLLLFQFTYARAEKKRELLTQLEQWGKEREKPEQEVHYLAHINWKEFQLDYRDYIDFIKLLQLLPGFGAIVGFFANSHFIDLLSETAMNGYRMRIIT